LLAQLEAAFENDGAALQGTGAHATLPSQPAAALHVRYESAESW